jgi:hypothetical protein
MVLGAAPTSPTPFLSLNEGEPGASLTALGNSVPGLLVQHIVKRPSPSQGSLEDEYAQLSM